MSDKKHNLSIVGSKDSLPETQAETEQESAFIRFLTWIRFFERASTMHGNTDGKTINWTFVFVSLLLFGIVAFAFLAVIFIGGFIWLDFKEDWRGTEAHRENEKTRYIGQLQKRCEDEVFRHKGMIEVYRQMNDKIKDENLKIKVPPDFLIVTECGTFIQSEKPK